MKSAKAIADGVSDKAGKEKMKAYKGELTPARDQGSRRLRPEIQGVSRLPRQKNHPADIVRHFHRPPLRPVA